MESKVVQNPLEGLTDQDLWNIQVILSMACGRNQTVLKKKNRDYLCYLRQSMDIESQLRGLPTPRPPYGTGDVSHNPPGAV